MHYSGTKKFTPLDFSNTDRTIVVQANGGSVQVFAALDVDADLWVPSGDPYTTDDVDYFCMGNCPIKIVPTGGAKYNLY